MRVTKRILSLALVTLGPACGQDEIVAPEPVDDETLGAALFSSPLWHVEPTYHADEERSDRLAPDAMVHVVPFYVAASTTAPARLRFTLAAPDAPSDEPASDAYAVKIAIFGPYTAAGTRTRLGYTGYTSRSTAMALDIRTIETGSHVAIVSAYRTRVLPPGGIRYALRATCQPQGAGERCDGLDAVRDPLSGALEDGPRISIHLNPRLGERTITVDASRHADAGPGQAPIRIAAVRSYQGAAIVPLPEPVWPDGATPATSFSYGDNVYVRVLAIDRAYLPYDSGTRVRVWPEQRPWGSLRHARAERARHALHVEAVVAMFEGMGELWVFDEDRGEAIGRALCRVTAPGHTGFLNECVVDVPVPDAIYQPPNPLLSVRWWNDGLGDDPRILYCLRAQPDGRLIDAACPAPAEVAP